MKDMNKTSNKLKFDNKAIEQYSVPEWSYTDRDGLPKHRNKIYVPFHVPKKSTLKGLKLYISRSSKAKYFVLNIWINKKPKYYSVGKFDLETFGTKEVEEKLHHIVKTHTDDNRKWIKDPTVTEKNKTRIIKTEAVTESKQRTINEVIEKLVEKELPKTKNEGTLASRTAREQIRFLIGYNIRTNHLSYWDDENGNGHISLKPDYKRRAKAPLSIEELFKKFPAGKGCNADKRSIYDCDLGKTLIKDLDSGLINLHLAGSPSYSYKKHLIKTFKTLWYFAKDEGYLGSKPGTDPTLSITIKRPAQLSNKSFNSFYNDKTFEKEDVEVIMQKLMELSPTRPFTAEAILFVLISGQRETEVLKLKKENVEIWQEPTVVAPGTPDETKIYGIINFPAGICKRRNKGKKVYINEPMLALIKQLNDHYKKPGFEHLRLIPWLFPNPTRINKKRLNDQERDYIFSSLTRLKTLKSTWDVVRDELNIFGVVRMFRKTFVSLGKEEAGLNNKDMKPLSNHDQERTIDIHYDKSIEKNVMKNAGKIAKVFIFPKAG